MATSTTAVDRLSMASGLGLRERKKEQTRQLIAETARRLFTKRGFDAVTVSDVAQEANVSEGTVFNYFPTKEDLFYSGAEVFEAQLIDAVRDRRIGEAGGRGAKLAAEARSQTRRAFARLEAGLRDYAVKPSRPRARSHDYRRRRGHARV